MPKTILDTEQSGSDFTAVDVTSEAWTPTIDQPTHSFQITTRQADGTQVLSPIMVHVANRRPAYIRARWVLGDTKVYIEGSNHPEQTDMWTTLGDSGAFAVGAAAYLYVYAN